MKRRQVCQAGVATVVAALGEAAWTPCAVAASAAASEATAVAAPSAPFAPPAPSFASAPATAANATTAAPGAVLFNALLNRHVHLINDGRASQVNYAGLARAADRAQLQTVLADFSAVSTETYAAWPKAERLAFLINAYNGFTLEKVLTRWPKLASIRDFGRVFNNPWKDRFFTLLGAPRALDDIEHGLIRAPGAFDEPRIHVAVNCASVGCPALRAEVWEANRLDAQLEDAMQRFLSDRSRNRFDPASGTAELSSLFDWYGVDFTRGHQGFSSLQDLLARYADPLADAPADRARLRSGNTPIRFLPYDWALNAT